MTGFGEAVCEDQAFRVGFRIRGVNHKGLDINFRMPFEIGYLESQLRNHIKQRIFRGRMDVFAEFKLKEKLPDSGVFVDRQRMMEIMDIAACLRDFPDVTGNVDVNTLLRMPDLTVTTRIGHALPGDMEQAIEQTLHEAVTRFLESRFTEGQALCDDLVSRLAEIAEVFEQMERTVNKRSETLVEHIKARVALLLDDIALDENRLYQEVVFQADRLDVSEEITRLNAHVDDLRKSIGRGSRPIGKRLEFLLQEAMREISTIGNKARSLDVASLVVKLKTEFEKVREQVLNIE